MITLIDDSSKYTDELEAKCYKSIGYVSFELFEFRTSWGQWRDMTWIHPSLSEGGTSQLSDDLARWSALDKAVREIEKIFKDQLIENLKRERTEAAKRSC